MESSRREFLVVTAALFGGTALLQACGGGTGTDGGSGTDSGGGMCASTTVTIAANHGHVLVVRHAEIAAGVAHTYPDITGSALHNHTVSLSAADYATLMGGGTVTVTSSTTSAHSHMITIRCA